MRGYGIVCRFSAVLIALSSMITVSHGSEDGAHYEPDWKLASWNARLPGFKTEISVPGLEFVKAVGVRMMRTKLRQLTIPDISGSFDIALETVYYKDSNMKITSVSIPSSSLTAWHGSTAQGLRLKANGVSSSIWGRWHYYKAGLIPWSDSGTFDATASSIRLDLTISVGVDSSGRPTVHSRSQSDCYFHVDNMEYNLHGGGSWFYNLFNNEITKKIKEEMNGQVCSKIINMVNVDLTKKLRTFKMVAPIEKVALIDYSLVSAPTFNYTIVTAHKGEVYPISGLDECQLIIPTIRPDSGMSGSKMVYLWITDFLPNSAGEVFQKTGLLQYTVTPQNVPPEQKKYLNTSSTVVKLMMIPQITKMYPDMAMEISFNSTKAPFGTFKPEGIDAVFVGDISPYVILPNGTLAFLLKLNVTINAKVALDTSNNNVTWKISSLSTEISLICSAVGKVDVKKLQSAVDLAIKFYLIKNLNDYGAIGVPLPQMEGFTLINPVIKHGLSFVKIGTDMTYSGEDFTMTDSRYVE